MHGHGQREGQRAYPAHEHRQGDKYSAYGANYYLRILFETTSAFGTVGLSAGITPVLSDIGKILISITMFAGRIGPLTLALAVAMREEKSLFSYPEEQIMVG